MVIYLLPLVRGYKFKFYKSLYSIGYNLRTAIRVTICFIIFYINFLS